MKNYKTLYSGNNKENVWELFYEQPGLVSLDEVYHSKNVILGGIWAAERGYSRFKDPELKLRYCQVACKYIRPISEFEKIINDEMLRVFGREGGEQKENIRVCVKGDRL